jgi:hypothetical protein
MLVFIALFLLVDISSLGRSGSAFVMRVWTQAVFRMQIHLDLGSETLARMWLMLIVSVFDSVSTLSVFLVFDPAY